MTRRNACRPAQAIIWPSRWTSSACCRWSACGCRSDGAMTDKVADIELRLLLEALYLRYHYDFRSYARSSLRRRLRVAVGKSARGGLCQLQHRLTADGGALTA